MSGHNRWSKIKHKKGAEDAKRGKIYSKVIKEITLAARMGGGDVSAPRLRRAIELAKSINMPFDNIDRAIKKGTGELEGVTYDEITYEGVGPQGTLFLVEVVTDNKNRTAAEVRKIFDLRGGALGGPGSSAWAFDEKGVIRLAQTEADEEKVFDLAVSAGAEEIVAAGDDWIVTTPREALDAVRDALTGAGLEVAESQLAKLPKTAKIFDGKEVDAMLALVDMLEDHDDVQKVYTDFELGEAALARLEQG